MHIYIIVTITEALDRLNIKQKSRMWQPSQDNISIMLMENENEYTFSIGFK